MNGSNLSKHIKAALKELGRASSESQLLKGAVDALQRDPVRLQAVRKGKKKDPMRIHQSEVELVVDAIQKAQSSLESALSMVANIDLNETRFIPSFDEFSVNEGVHTVLYTVDASEADRHLDYEDKFSAFEGEPEETGFAGKNLGLVTMRARVNAKAKKDAEAAVLAAYETAKIRR